MLKKLLSRIKDKKKGPYFRNSLFEIFLNNKKPNNRRFSGLTENRFIDFTKLKDKRDVSVFNEGLRHTSLHTAKAYYLDKLKLAMEEDLKKIRVPTLIIGSRRDLLCPVSTTKKMNKLIKGSELRILKKADHLSLLQSTDKINRFIYSFLIRNFK
jgi:pimeloyl-ACP methyl ester carboxylesterase